MGQGMEACFDRVGGICGHETGVATTIGLFIHEQNN